MILPSPNLLLFRHLAVCWMVAVGASRAADQPVSGDVFFETSVAAILKESCVDCHNQEKQKGELDLSSPAGIRKGSESGAVFEQGKPEESLIYELAHSGEMPKKGEPLVEAQLETIRRWIESGAKFQTAAVAEEEGVHQHDVLPIVLLRCTACHGAREQKGGLDMRTPKSMLTGGESGSALIAGDAEGSRMIQRIESQACPPQHLLLTKFVRRPPTAEVDVLKEWINAGTPVLKIEPDVATTDPDPLVSDEDRQHWAFQPPRVAEGVGDSVDDFVGRALAAKGLDFSPLANRDTLIRRAYIDLVGLPPTTLEWQRWRDSEDANWYATMIDHLLASPRYGERWGRYWLDVAGYADSEGGVSADPLREVAWKYRDYVIEAFNGDKPYDRFLLEQIAGDELVDVEKATEVTDEMVANLVATGFLRMGIDQTGSRTMNYVPERLGVVGDAINVLGSGVMGLTMECVKCHTHKYDPIPQRDYYRLKAVLQGAYDEHDWLNFKTRRLAVATAEHRERVGEVNPPLESELKKLDAKLRKAVSERQLVTLREHYPDQAEEDQQATLVALRKADNQRTLTQRTLVEMLQRAEAVEDGDQPPAVMLARNHEADLEQAIIDLRRKMVPPTAVRALWDRGVPSPTYILRRGEHTKPGRLVGPGVPSVLTDGQTPLLVEPPFPGGTPKSGRRLAFARWLTEPDHPLTARVMVNRIWHHHFGTGLVKTLENFGVKGERPSHPELLDWLSVEFVERDWSIKEMHRLMMNSRTYRQSSRVSDDRIAADPQNRLLSRMPLRRMDAEVLRDSLLFVAGKLDLAIGGPPDGVSVDRNGLVSVDASASGGWRRSVYLQYRRTEIPTMMDTFDYPEMGPNCVQRSVSTVSPQSLMLMNNDHIRELAGDFAERVIADLSENASAGDRVDAVYRITLSRKPSAEERQLGEEALEKLSAAWGGDSQAVLHSFCHTILNSAAFSYVD